jgi:hypothetical protein
LYSEKLPWHATGGSFGQACRDSYRWCKCFPRSFIGGQECSIFYCGNAYGGLQLEGSLEDGGRLAYGLGELFFFRLFEVLMEGFYSGSLLCG